MVFQLRIESLPKLCSHGEKNTIFSYKINDVFHLSDILIELMKSIFHFKLFLKIIYTSNVIDFNSKYTGTNVCL